jgi:hypothetical protein
VHGANCAHGSALTPEALSKLSIKELKALLRSRGLSFAGCLYKEDLVSKLLE